MSITPTKRTVYYSKAAARSYLTLRGACMAQARKALRAKYGEPYEYDTGAGYDPMEDEEMQPLLNRYFRMLMVSARNK